MTRLLLLDHHHQNPNTAIATAIPPTRAGIAIATGNEESLLDEFAGVEVSVSFATTETVTNDWRLWTGNMCRLGRGVGRGERAIIAQRRCGMRLAGDEVGRARKRS